MGMTELNRIQTIKSQFKPEWTVKLDGKAVGKIVKWTDIGYIYYPKGQSLGGDPFPTLGACIDSLRSE